MIASMNISVFDRTISLTVPVSLAMKNQQGYRKRGCCRYALGRLCSLKNNTVYVATSHESAAPMALVTGTPLRATSNKTAVLSHAVTIESYSDS